MKFESIETLKTEEEQITYFLTEKLHIVEDFGEICEYGIAISLEREDIVGCSFAEVPYICDNIDFVKKIISLLIKEQALPIHLEDIIYDLLG